MECESEGRAESSTPWEVFSSASAVFAYRKKRQIHWYKERGGGSILTSYCSGARSSLLDCRFGDREVNREVVVINWSASSAPNIGRSPYAQANNKFEIFWKAIW